MLFSVFCNWLVLAAAAELAWSVLAAESLLYRQPTVMFPMWLSRVAKRAREKLSLYAAPARQGPVVLQWPHVL
jgi:hypothetical protein